MHTFTECTLFDTLRPTLVDIVIIVKYLCLAPSQPVQLSQGDRRHSVVYILSYILCFMARVVTYI